jgi:hypothetical protein
MMINGAAWAELVDYLKNHFLLERETAIRDLERFFFLLRGMGLAQDEE